MKIKNLIEIFSESGKFQVYGYYTKAGVVLRRDDGVELIYLG